MSRITEGLYAEDGEVARWAIERENDTDAFELRVAIKEPYTGTARVAIFIDEQVGDYAKSVSLNAEHVDELIADLQEVRSVLRGEAQP